MFVVFTYSWSSSQLSLNFSFFFLFSGGGLQRGKMEEISEKNSKTWILLVSESISLFLLALTQTSVQVLFNTKTCWNSKHTVFANSLLVTYILLLFYNFYQQTLPELFDFWEKQPTLEKKKFSLWKANSLVHLLRKKVLCKILKQGFCGQYSFTPVDISAFFFTPLVVY